MNPLFLSHTTTWWLCCSWFSFRFSLSLDYGTLSMYSTVQTFKKFFSLHRILCLSVHFAFSFGNWETVAYEHRFWWSRTTFIRTFIRTKLRQESITRDSCCRLISSKFFVEHIIGSWALTRLHCPAYSLGDCFERFRHSLNCFLRQW